MASRRPPRAARDQRGAVAGRTAFAPWRPRSSRRLHPLRRCRARRPRGGPCRGRRRRRHRRRRRSSVLARTLRAASDRGCANHAERRDGQHAGQAPRRPPGGAVARDRGARRSRSSRMASTRWPRVLRVAMDSAGTASPPVQPAGQGHQLLRVGLGLALAADDRVVAGALGLQAQAPPQRPGERVRPVEGQGHAGEEVRGPVPARDVLELVADRAPAAPCSSQLAASAGSRMTGCVQPKVMGTASSDEDADLDPGRPSLRGAPSRWRGGCRRRRPRRCGGRDAAGRSRRAAEQAEAGDAEEVDAVEDGRGGDARPAAVRGGRRSRWHPSGRSRVPRARRRLGARHGAAGAGAIVITRSGTKAPASGSRSRTPKLAAATRWRSDAEARRARRIRRRAATIASVAFSISAATGFSLAATSAPGSLVRSFASLLLQPLDAPRHLVELVGRPLLGIEQGVDGSPGDPPKKTRTSRSTAERRAADLVVVGE